MIHPSEKDARALGLAGARRSKYNAQKVTVDGIVFDSKAEAKRYGMLRLLRDQDFISGLQVHPVFHFRVNDILIGKYEADFDYLDRAKNARVIEDVKGVKTAVYRLKKKLLLALYGLAISEVDADGNPPKVRRAKNKGRKR